MAWLSMQLLRCADRAADLPNKRRVPSPLLGRWRAGATSEAVFCWLANPRRARVWWTKAAIVAGTGASPKAIDWALSFLRGIGAVELIQDSRNERYHRYRVTGGAAARSAASTRSRT